MNLKNFLATENTARVCGFCELGKRLPILAYPTSLCALMKLLAIRLRLAKAPVKSLVMWQIGYGVKL